MTFKDGWELLMKIVIMLLLITACYDIHIGEKIDAILSLVIALGIEQSMKE